MAAAPADFRAGDVSDAKIKKADDGSAPDDRAGAEPRHPRTSSARTGRAPGQVVVGFAAETGDDTGSVLDLARAKLARKGCDLLVVNDVSGGAVFGSADNEAVILAADGGSRRRAARARRPRWPTSSGTRWPRSSTDQRSETAVPRSGRR